MPRRNALQALKIAFLHAHQKGYTEGHVAGTAAVAELSFDLSRVSQGEVVVSMIEKCNEYSVELEGTLAGMQSVGEEKARKDEP